MFINNNDLVFYIRFIFSINFIISANNFNYYYGAKAAEAWEMKMGLAAHTIVIAIFTISLAASEMPPSFYQAMSGMQNENVLCVKNYRAGASVTESYANFESLDRETEIVSLSCGDAGNNASLVASINSDVVGFAHVAWQSLEQQPDSKGRHVTYGRSVENLIGAFSIEKFILLRSNSSDMGVRLDWLPCA